MRFIPNIVKCGSSEQSAVYSEDAGRSIDQDARNRLHAGGYRGADPAASAGTDLSKTVARRIDRHALWATYFQDLYGLEAHQCERR